MSIFYDQFYFLQGCSYSLTEVSLATVLLNQQVSRYLNIFFADLTYHYGAMQILRYLCLLQEGDSSH